MGEQPTGNARSPPGNRETACSLSGLRVVCAPETDEKYFRVGVERPRDDHMLYRGQWLSVYAVYVCSWPGDWRASRCQCVPIVKLRDSRTSRDQERKRLHEVYRDNNVRVLSFVPVRVSTVRWLAPYWQVDYYSPAHDCIVYTQSVESDKVIAR